jgi:hypothetical protein
MVKPMDIRAWLWKWQTELGMAATSDLFIRSTYLSLIWLLAKMIPIGDIVWGSDYLTLLWNPYSGPDALATFMNDPSWREHYLWLVFPLLALLISGVFGLYNALTRLFVWYLFVVLHYANIEVSTGGHHLFEQILFFQVFLFRVSPRAEGYVASALRFLHHLGFYAIWIQIGIMYFVAAYWKLKGVYWLSGEAMLLSLSWKEFGFPWLSEAMQRNTWYLALGNYLVFAYQLLFVILIWMRPIRGYLLLFGLLFHLSIAFIVGITDFGLLIAVSYLVFLPEGSAKKIAQKLRITSATN